jgi:uncharacterized RDD family membrane protein YckC
MSESVTTSASTFRQIAASTYDGLLLIAVLMLVTALLQIFTHGEALTRRSIGAAEFLYRTLLAASIVCYFGSCWTRRGQTLGMKAWNIRIESRSGARPRWIESARRLASTGPLLMAKRINHWQLLLFLSPLTLSYCWNTVTRRGTLHDLLSRTRVVRVEITHKT